MKRSDAAFMLIEVMVVVALLGMLLAALVPGYQQQILSSYRLEAMQELQRLAILQQQFFIEQQRYTAELSMVAAPDDSYLSSSGRFRISATLQPDGYILLAEAVGPQRKDNECQWFRLDQAGRRFSSPGSGCWQTE
jgi:type IV pilus assembly protein PilE